MGELQRYPSLTRVEPPWDWYGLQTVAILDLFANDTNEEVIMGYTKEEIERLASSPITEGVFMVRVGGPGDVITNVEHRVKHHSPTGLEYGYGGSGPSDMALNLCEMIVEEEGFETNGFVELSNGSVSRTTYRVYQDVKWALIAKVDDAGGVLAYDRVLDVFKEAADGCGVSL